jgi:hypothetical protein
MDNPFFSVLITAYNRAQEVERCVRTCMQQTFQDLEIVVVDDASTDDTVAVLNRLGEPRLRVISHEHNRGISPARATAVDHARGEWIVMLDSDWDLFPYSLARLRALIDELPPGVRIIRSRLQADDGRLDPAILPSGVTDYRDRLEWLEALSVAGAGSDAGHCIHRLVFATTNYFADRRGAMEALWELDLARHEPSMWVPDILGRQHVDASNSHTRETNPRRLIPRLLTEAPDAVWMTQTMLAEHGTDLARYAPHYRRWLEETGALQAFLAGDRGLGIRYTRAAVRDGAAAPKAWATLLLGLLGPHVLAYAKLGGRRARARWGVAQSRVD